VEIFAPGVGNGELPLPFRIGKIQQGFQLIGFDQRRVVDNDPEPAGQADPGIIRCAELWRDCAVDFSHVQGPENPRRPGLLKAAGIVGQEKIRGGSIAFCLESIDEFRCSGRKEIHLNAGLRGEFIQDRFDQSF